MRFAAPTDTWLSFPAIWPGTELGDPWDLASIASSWFFPDDADDAAREVWDADCAAHVGALVPDVDVARFLWLGAPVSPAPVLRLAQFDPVGSAASTLRTVAGLSGSIPGAMEVAVSGPLPAGIEAAVRSERPLAAVPVARRRRALPDRVDVRWAVRLTAGPDVLITLADVPAVVMEEAARDVEAHLGALTVLDAAGAKDFDAAVEDQVAAWCDNRRL